MEELSHLDSEGRARMVDVTGKKSTIREAVAQGYVQMRPETLEKIRERQIRKGDVLAVAQVAGILAAKKTAEIIPMCHPLQITKVDLSFELLEKQSQIRIQATVSCTDRTGVEMEALLAVAVAALTIYDMCKAIDRGMAISQVELIKKTGGKSGRWKRKRVDSGQ